VLHPCLGHIISWYHTSTLFAGLTQNKLPCRTSSGNRPEAAASNAGSADVPSTDRTALEPTVPAVATQNASDAPKAPDLSSPLQAQEQTSLAKCVPKTPITVPDVVMTASKPTKQASSFKSSLPIPTSCKPPPSSAAKHALTPFGKSQSQMVFRTITSSSLSAPAFKAVNAPPLTQPARAALALPLPAATSTAVPGTKATITLPSQHSSIRQPTAQGMAGLTQKLSSSLTSASIGKPKDAGNKGGPAAQVPFKFSSLSVPQSKTINAVGPALQGFPKQPARISGGSTRSLAAPFPSFSFTPVQTAARFKPSGLSSAPIGLSGPPCVIGAVSLPNAAATPVRLPVSSVPAVPKAASPRFAVTGPAHSTDTDQQLSPIAGITRTPPVKQAQQQQQPLPQTNQPAVSALSCGDVQMRAPETPMEKDAVLGEEGENSLPTAKPWTSTSLAGGLMGNMKSLEAVRCSILASICVSFAIFSVCTYVYLCDAAFWIDANSSMYAIHSVGWVQMLFEVQQMHDDILECKVDAAISSNWLTRLDNPLVHDKLRSLKRQAETVFQAAAEE